MKTSINYLRDENQKLVILDEINVAIKLGYISSEEVLSGISKRPHLTHVVLTGRGAAPEIIEKADLVTEMNLINHRMIIIKIYLLMILLA